MAGKWRDTTLGEFVTLQRGHDLTDAERRPGTVPVIGAAGENGFHDKAMASGPGIVVGRSGASFGQVHYCETDFWPHNTGLYVTDFRGNDPRFSFYIFKALDFSPYNSGSAQPSLNRNFIYPIEVSIPPPDEQRAIAHILGTLDDKIEVNRRMNKTLEAMARALFKSWFIDFDPVRRNADRGRNQPSPRPSSHPSPIGRGDGDEGVVAGEAYDHLFPDSFEDSELGEVPRGWEVCTIGDLSELNPESWSTETRPAVIEYVDLSNTKWGRIEAVTTFNAADAPSRAQRVLRQGDTVVGTVRPGNGSYALILVNGLTGSTGFAVLRPRSDKYAEFVYLAATAADNIDALAHLADGGAYPAVRPEVVAATQVARPKDDVHDAFSRTAGSILRKIAGNEHESGTLDALRDALLPKLISGELRVKGAERIVELV